MADSYRRHKKRHCEEEAECRELWNDCIRPELAAALGAPVPETADIYSAISQIAKDLAVTAVTEGATVIEDGDNIEVTGAGTAIDPYVVNGQAAFKPEHTKFVAKAWDGVVDDEVFFTTISAALAQIVAEDPLRNSDNPWSVLIYSGTYTENVEVPSNVCLIGTDLNAVTIAGNVSWNAGAGINAALSAGREQVSIYDLTINGALSTNTTAKTGNSISLFEAANILQAGGQLSTVGRPSVAGVPRDSFVVKSSGVSATTVSHTEGGLIRYLDTGLGGDTLVVTAAALGDLRFEAWDIVHSFETSTYTNAQLYIESGTFDTFQVDEPGTGLRLLGDSRGEILNGAFSRTNRINVDAASQLNLGGSHFLQDNLTGAGRVARTISHYSATFEEGVSNFVFPVPYLGSYQVHLTQLDGVPALAPVVTAKTDSQFSCNSAVTANYDILVTQTSLASELS